MARGGRGATGSSATAALRRLRIPDRATRTRLSRMIQSYLDALRLFSRNAWLFLISSGLSGFSYTGIYFLLANLFLLRLGHGEGFIGIFVATGALSFAVFSVPAGFAGRCWGPRPAMIVGYGLLAAGIGIVVVGATGPRAVAPVWLIGSCVVRELGNAFYMVNANPFLMASTTPEERAHVFSVRGAVTPLAGFAGSLTGGLVPHLTASVFDLSLQNKLCYIVPILLAAVALVPGLVALMATRREERLPAEEAALAHADLEDLQAGGAPGGEELLAVAELGEGATASRRVGAAAAAVPPAEPVGERPEESPADSSAAPYGPIAVMSLVGLLYIASTAGATSFFNVYMDRVLHASTARIGNLVAIGQLLASPLALSLAVVAGRWGYHRAFAVTTLGMSLSLLPLALVPRWTAAGAGIIGVTALGALAFPSITVYTQHLVARTWRPVISGAYMMCVALGWTVIAGAGGFVISYYGYPSLFLLCSALTATGSAIFLIYTRRPRGLYRTHGV